MMLLGIFIILGVIGRSLSCPLSCICKWKGGKQTVECVNKSLITIPDGMDQGTQVLDFSGNNLQSLPRERFQRMGLINLQKIYLARCRIRQIDDRSFKGLTNLVELDLSDNLISSIPTETFFDYTSLMRLTLNGNSIREIKTAAFRPLTYLTTLDLNNCQIEKIEDSAFVGLNNLEWLKLDNNKIARIEGSQILPESLHGIDLHHNPWYCDCKLLDLRSWLLNSKVPHTIDPKCSGPQRLKGYLVKNLEIDDLACLPDVTPTTVYIEIEEGKNVSLLCRVYATPEARVSWWFKGNILQNDSVIAPGLHLYYYIEEGTTEKKSELFIFNTNIEDNGTFICVAENPAGRTQSNQTIRIVVKEEPVVGIPVFPYEYVIVISAAVSVLALLIVITIALCFIRCRRQRRRRKKKQRSKEVALQMPQQFSKSPGTRSEVTEHITRLGNSTSNTIPVKANGSVVVSERQPHEMLLYSTGAGGVVMVPNNHACPPYSSPTSSLRNYPLEQNPDLLNDMESVNKERRTLKTRIDEKDQNTTERKEPMESIMEEPSWRDDRYKTNMVAMPRGITGSREIYQQQHLTADVHLSPSKFIGNDGYPVDFGLPKVASHYPVMVPPASFYRTLPHKSSRHSAANPGARFSREAEFLSKSVHPPSYEHCNPSDVRYTVEGYPCAQTPQPSALFATNPHGTSPYLLPSPPAQYKCENASSTNLPRDASAQWPETSLDSPRVLSICNAAAQTIDDSTSANNAANISSNSKTSETNQPSHNSLRLHPVLTESPDEGYEGETAETSDI